VESELKQKIRSGKVKRKDVISKMFGEMQGFLRKANIRKKCEM
jgi:hypothetical protein